MNLRPRTDFWQVGVVPAPAPTLTQPAALAALRSRVVWLPEPGSWRYLADPFAVWRGGGLHVFVEAFDYRTRLGVIEHHELSSDFVWRGRQVALAGPSHFSFPFLIEMDGEVFMVPENQRSNEVALYRARHFPGDWVRETALLPDLRGADAAVVHFEDRWWMFFTIVGPAARDQRELHLAFADRLTGPWQLHPQNPIRDNRTGARPGGTPFVSPDGVLTLPAQDCSETYGGAIRFLRFPVLDPDIVVVETSTVRLTGDLVSMTHCDGLHTFSSCGAVTLIDAKRIARTFARFPIDWGRKLRGIIST
ncbi:MAG TPA: glycosyl hydrolase family 43 [Candidatus Limnocylindria bacterium]|jgi:hypothetical protein|nr:glycosyl hydrolase family 43 [Candidatus Limnocylindria bacterium]HTL69468.1 hypothetical protein [Lacunisphaera sp.]